jgi:hypothetical protein
MKNNNHEKGKQMKSEDLAAIIRGLLEPEGREENITALDILLVIALIIRGALQKPIRASNATLSHTLGVSEPTITASLGRLHAAGWVQTQNGKWKSVASFHMVVLEKLPVAEMHKRTVISALMLEFAKRYGKAIAFAPGRRKKRRFTTSHYQRWAFTFQFWLDRHCDGDAELLRAVLNFILLSPASKWRMAAFVGPHRLRKHFTTVLVIVKREREQAQTPATAA